MDFSIANSLCGANLTGREVEVGIQLGVLVVLHAVILPAEAKIHRKSGHHFPTILDIQGRLFVTVAPAEIRLAEGQIDRFSREMTLGIDGHGHGARIAGQESGYGGTCATAAQIHAGRLVSAEGAIVAQVFKAPAEPQIVLAENAAQVLVQLNEVLRSAEGDAAARGVRRIARVNHRLAEQGVGSG